MSNAIGELTTSMAQARAFAKCDFQMGLVEGKNTVMSPPRKKALATHKKLKETASRAFPVRHSPYLSQYDLYQL